MHLRFAVSALSIIFVAACSGNSDGPKAYVTFQDCYTDQHAAESSACAIEACCIEHPIGSSSPNAVCEDNADNCKAFVNQNLTDASDANLSADIISACNFYIVDSGRGSGTGSTCTNI